MCEKPLDWVRQPNSIERNPMNWVRLGSNVQFFVWAWFRSITKLNRTQSMDWVMLSWSDLIYYAGYLAANKSYFLSKFYSILRFHCMHQICCYVSQSRLFLWRKLVAVQYIAGSLFGSRFHGYSQGFLNQCLLAPLVQSPSQYLIVPHAINSPSSACAPLHKFKVPCHSSLVQFV